MAGADTPFEAGDAGAIDDLDAFLGDAIARRVFPGAVAAFGRTEGPVVCRTAGHLTYEPDEPVDVGTRYDLASLTKVVATTSRRLSVVVRSQNSASLSQAGGTTPMVARAALTTATAVLMIASAAIVARATTR